MKVYLAHPISTSADYHDSKAVAEALRNFGYDVYVASENDKINDKSNDPTPVDIYQGDISQIVNSQVLVVNLTGGHQDGTISEVGFVAGLNEERFKQNKKLIRIIGYTTNARLLKPQFHKGLPSAHVNHLVLGMVEMWGEFVGSETDMLTRLQEGI